MPAEIFDGLPDLFAETFGEPGGVVYTPVATGVPLAAPIPGIVMDDPVDVVVGGDRAQATDVRKVLHLRTSDVAAPAEGDLAQIVATGVTWKVVPPFRPDGHGMVAVDLAEV